MCIQYDSYTEALFYEKITDERVYFFQLSILLFFFFKRFNRGLISNIEEIHPPDAFL